MSPDAASPPTSNELAAQRTVLADDRTKLALTRTFVALDRTLMAWVRTSTSLISFGFTIYKFFQTLNESQGSRDQHFVTVRGAAILLMGLGVGGLVFATFEHLRQRRELKAQYRQYGPYPRSTVTGVATIVAGLGILGVVVVALRQ